MGKVRGVIWVEGFREKIEKAVVDVRRPRSGSPRSSLCLCAI